MIIRDEEEYRRVIIDIEAQWDTARLQADLGDLAQVILAAEAFERDRRSADKTLHMATDGLRSPISDSEMMQGLSSAFVLRAYIGWKSAAASLRACRLLFLNHTRATTFWMNKRMFGFDETPLELAEQDVGGLQLVLDHIGRIDAGVFH